MVTTFMLPVMKDAIKEFTALILIHYVAFFSRTTEPLANIFAGHKPDIQPEPLAQRFACQRRFVRMLMGENVRCTRHPPRLWKWPGAASPVSGSDERNTSRSGDACVTIHVCLWPTGWKRWSWMAPIHSNIQLRSNWFGVFYRHVARQHPRILCTFFWLRLCKFSFLSSDSEQPQKLFSQEMMASFSHLSDFLWNVYSSLSQELHWATMTLECLIRFQNEVKWSYCTGQRLQKWNGNDQIILFTCTSGNLPV